MMRVREMKDASRRPVASLSFELPGLQTVLIATVLKDRVGALSSAASAICNFGEGNFGWGIGAWRRRNYCSTQGVELVYESAATGSGLLGA
jgi:hypothetical protein